MTIIADGQTDNRAALKALIDENATIDLPEGIIAIEGDLDVYKPAILRGKGGGFRAQRTTLRFYGGGLRVHPTGRGFHLEECAIRGDESHTASPLVALDAQATLRNVYMLKHGADGIVIDGRASEGLNANGWQLSHVWAEDLAGWCVRTRGSDAQAAVAMDIHAINCGGGFYEGSFLGSTWVGCHAEYCGTLGGYLCDGSAARALFLGCYAENDSWQNSWIGSPAMVIGGTLAAAMRTMPATRPGTGQPRATFLDDRWAAPQTWENASPTQKVWMQVGGPIDGRTALSLQDRSASGGDPHEFSIQAEASGRMWSLVRARSTLNRILAWTRQGHNLGLDQLLAPRGIHLGVTAGRHVRYAATMPGASEGAVGDVVLSTAPTSTLDGWRRCDDGNGPFWRPFVWSAPA